MASAEHHTINYIELAAPDLAGAKAFYAEAFGWSFNEYGTEYAGIRASDGEGEIGGLDRGAEAGSGHPLAVIYSDDLDATLASVVAAGGRITTEPFDFPGGRRFHFADPAGNELAVWTKS